jgi:hypothetical protein
MSGGSERVPPKAGGCVYNEDCWSPDLSLGDLGCLARSSSFSAGITSLTSLRWLRRSPPQVLLLASELLPQLSGTTVNAFTNPIVYTVTAVALGPGFLYIGYPNLLVRANPAAGAIVNEYPNLSGATSVRNRMSTTTLSVWCERLQQSWK